MPPSIHFIWVAEFKTFQKSHQIRKFTCWKLLCRAYGNLFENVYKWMSGRSRVYCIRSMPKCHTLKTINDGSLIVVIAFLFQFIRFYLWSGWFISCDLPWRFLIEFGFFCRFNVNETMQIKCKVPPWNEIMSIIRSGWLSWRTSLWYHQHWHAQPHHFGSDKMKNVSYINNKIPHAIEF